MTANGQVMAISPADALRDRLDDPQIASSLNSLLDHADLLAILVASIDGFLRRGDEIGESLAAAVGELNLSSLSAQSIPGAESLKDVDLPGLAASLASLSGAVVGATPALNTMLTSRLTDPEAAEVLALLGQALVEGKAAAEADPGGPKGIFGMWRVTKDKDVQRGLGLVVQVARAFGRRLAQE
ncbi:MAG: DUF1641 domain-containing protein [Mycobacterium pseudokansasii]|uniref:DUF1641 domain-containing protein n=1 Tax=Mycobacterium pseudokansasii TaxID=2341080 RepID=UPI000BAF3DF4|nr:DUF1641 domain-containing protein [Mycobacterium pseudokansasii]MBX9638194.1 DUF1641 domain-containing protein [Mycobacteriaceae bacterium]MBY0386627.1 DUF1641 domain-containing protein [Mycobacterium pseudokansasii]PBA03634.1 hypothetical protein CKJ73_24720 [Mycobacterium avium]